MRVIDDEGILLIWLFAVAVAFETRRTSRLQWVHHLQRRTVWTDNPLSVSLSIRQALRPFPGEAAAGTSKKLGYDPRKQANVDGDCRPCIVDALAVEGIRGLQLL